MSSFDEFTLTDLIDVQTLQEIQDGFANITGMAAITTDADGIAITRGSNFTDFCNKLTRGSHIGCERCEKCDKQGAEQALASGKASTYFCHAGLCDFAAPIMVNGKLLGSFVGGQVLPNPINESKIRNYASEIGVNPEEYVRAAKKVKVISKKQIDAAAEFLGTIADILSKNAYNSYLANINSHNLSSLNSNIIEGIHDAEILIDQNTEYMNKLNENFDKLHESAKRSVIEVRSTNETVSLIQNIAMNTRILGFNAYIEAARAKEYGKSFGVITQEIRDLADTSKASADKIEDAMKTIDTFTKQVEEQIKSTEALLRDSVENINKLSNILKNLLQS